jgi:hypothetical protein
VADNMNDKYKQLARDAGLLVHNPDKMPTKLSIFAELLLFECIKLAVFKGDPETGKAIKEHFGVTP